MARRGLGFLLEELREKRGLSLRELAQLAGIDHAYIYRLESGDKESPSEEALTKLIRALKPERREAEMLRYVAEHTDTDASLIKLVLADQTISFDIFAAVAGAAFRGTARPDYPRLIERVRRILDEERGNR
jgi:transcriptional regulator with XRE-family HTH domain